MIRVYNRQIPAPLPAHMMLTREMANLPSQVDLRAWCGPVKDQGNEGSCTGHAFSSAREWISRRYFGEKPVLSPQYAYVRALMAQGSFPNDSGSDGETLSNVLIANGCCEASEFPYVPGQIVAPTAEQDQNARGYKLGAYHGLSTSGVLLSVLGDPVPWPIEVGFTVYESFESDQVAKTGIMPVPEPGEKVLGGHEILCVGYDAVKKLALIQNSWSSDWGQSGFFWMPFQVLDDLSTDLKIIHAGHKW